LPAVFRTRDRIEGLRSECLDRSHNNKEYARRVVVVGAAASSSGAGGGGTASSSSSSQQQQRKKSAAAVVAGGVGGGGSHNAATSAAANGDGGIDKVEAEAGAPAAVVVTSAAVAAAKKTGASGTSGDSSVPASRAATAAGSVVATTKAAENQQKKPSAVPDRAVSSTTGSSGAAAATGGGAPPKFTRNTPASSAAALDFRFNNSRAVLCATGNIVFDALTPPSGETAEPIDVSSVPQNPSSSGDSGSSSVNMGAVVVEAQTIAQRTIAVVDNAVRRSGSRFQYRKDNAEYAMGADMDLLDIPNPFGWDGRRENQPPDEVPVEGAGVAVIPHRPNPKSATPAWKQRCLPRFVSILERGAGHAIYVDVQWSTRHGRIASLLRELASRESANFGPHLIVTVQPELHNFCQEFRDLNDRLSLVIPKDRELQVLPYQGSKETRRKLRKYFPKAKGLSVSPFHVMVTTYSAFLEDYLHFCQVPFEAVILDDSASWMATANGDPNSAIGSIWENGIWSANDQQTGLAGTSIDADGWDFDVEAEDVHEDQVKEAWVGLTARHRIMTAPTLGLRQRSGSEPAPVSGLVNFVAPHFSDIVREEWDRSRIASDVKSMAHFRRLVARSTVVHSDADGVEMQQLAVRALNGKIASTDRIERVIPEIVLDDAFVSDGKINFSRRGALQWLGSKEQSWLRYELGKAMLQHILDAMKVSNKHGHFCEEITTASSTTSSGATGQVTGTMAYRLAIRCGRHFGSEQGLRQHISALHAPPGTWLCRTCGSDCMTSQARTHHERSCGQTTTGMVGGDQASSVGATPTVGQGSSGGKSGVGKKKVRGSTVASQQTAAAEEKDSDGSFRVPGYRGVWVNKSGKHFIKIDGERLKKGDDSDDLLLFDSIDDAARKYDDILKKKKKKGVKLELNFKADGSRIVYEDVSPASTSGLGGSTSSVVPALSIINIKVCASVRCVSDRFGKTIGWS